jgi:copper(I)-binding protein
MTARRLLVRLALAALVLGGCTYFPTVRDTGGVRMEPKNGRLVRVQGGAVCYFDLESTGKFEDTLLSAESQAARRVQIVSDDGRPLPVVRVPGETRLVFGPGGPRITLAELTQPLTPGDGVIVTLIFAKSGRIGVVSVVE